MPFVVEGDDLAADHLTTLATGDVEVAQVLGELCCVDDWTHVDASSAGVTRRPSIEPRAHGTDEAVVDGVGDDRDR